MNIFRKTVSQVHSAALNDSNETTKMSDRHKTDIKDIKLKAEINPLLR